MDQKKTGQFLRSLRNEKQMTQEQLAEHFNVTSRSVSRWENGNNLPDISLLVEIADFYEVDVREIIDGERKNEMMDKEAREVAEHMAVYAGTEKNRLLKFIQVIAIIGLIASITAIIFQTIGYDESVRSSVSLTASIITLILMSVITLYVTGILEKAAHNKGFMKTVKITSIVLLATGVLYMVKIILTFWLAIFLMVVPGLFERVKVDTDITKYNEYIHPIRTEKEIEDHGYGITNSEMFDIWPKTITADMNVTEFQYTYYNPWDAMYVIYMTSEYDPDAYIDEYDRLSSLGIQDYVGMYTVTGEPEGYDIISMSCDGYHGFTYAMIPEDSSDNDTITYVSIWFCNYYLELDIHKYLPDEYLLPGFDATDDNPYELEQRALYE